MAGDLINDYSVGDTNFDSMMITEDAQRIGFHSLTLTEFDTTTVPAIAAGSKVEINGAMATFDTEEAISGSPSDGDVYILLTPQAGTGSGATTDATGYATSSTVITLASAGTGTIIIGDNVVFAGDTNRYKVTSGDADVSNGGTITIASPGLLVAIPASATAITVYGASVTASFTNTAPTWSDSKQGWYGTGGTANDRYANFIITKASASYIKSVIPIDKTINLIFGENGDITASILSIIGMITESIIQNGYMNIGSLIIQWGSYSVSSGGGNTANVTFPKAFDTACFAVTLGSSDSGHTWINSRTTANFTLQAAAPSTFDGFFIAIGN